MIFTKNIYLNVLKSLIICLWPVKPISFIESRDTRIGKWNVNHYSMAMIPLIYSIFCPYCRLCNMEKFDIFMGNTIFLATNKDRHLIFFGEDSPHQNASSI